jgi:hypothetical protein
MRQMFTEDMQRGSVFSVTMRLYNDLDILIERHEEAQKALNGELTELTAQHLGNTLRLPVSYPFLLMASSV